VTRVRRLASGQIIGGIPFTRGSLGHLLRNRFYVGEVVYKGEILSGGQALILDRDLFDAVQAKLAGQQSNRTGSHNAFEAPLMGRIFDCLGNRMSPGHTRKKGTTYRYYISSPLLQGQPERAGPLHRVPAATIERLIADTVRRKIKLAPQAQNGERLLRTM
jgi:site-specific DNA recombinase